MKCGIYSATAGMMTSVERLNIIANNVANVNTTGYRSDLSFEQTLRFFREGPYPGKDQPVIGGTMLNRQPGMIKHTGRDLDLAIAGKGFFEVQDAEQNTYYTRNGGFYLNSNRELVTGDGLNVMDKFNRKIQIVGENPEYYFSKQGDLFLDGDFFTRLKVVDLSDRKDLVKRGNDLFKLDDETASPVLIEEPELELSALEGSNTEIMKEMGNMLTAQRAYEFQLRAYETLMSRTLRKTITELPKPL